MTLMFVDNLEVTNELKADLESIAPLDEIKDFHQAILNIAYSNLRQYEDPERPDTFNVPGWRNNRPWTHGLLADLTKNIYGELAEFAVLIGKYNQQVCNGGHYQYWDNNYASSEDRTEDITLHWRLRSYYEEFLDEVNNILNLDDNDKETLKKVQRCLEAFQDQLELNSDHQSKYISDYNGEIFLEEDDFNEEAKEPTDWCMNCWNNLDNDYYKVSENLLNILEDYFREKIKLS